MVAGIELDEVIIPLGEYESEPNPVGRLESVYKSLKVGGKCVITCHYFLCGMAYGNPNFIRQVSEHSLNWVNKSWREANKFECPAKIDFDVTAGLAVDPGLLLRAEDVQAHWRNHYANVIQQVIFTLVKRG